MKSTTIKYALYIVILAVAGVPIYHFGGRWWAQRQVNQLVFKELSKEQFSSLPAEWQQKMIEEVFVSAACGKDEKLTMSFLRAGYSPNSQNKKGLTPLHCAAGKGTLGLSMELVAAGADIKARTTEDAFMPLHYAALHHQWDIVRYFVKEGVSINEPSKHGTPMLIAANSETVMRIAHQLKPNHKNQKEPLATSIGILTSLGATLDTKTLDGNTLMHFAAKEQDTMVMDTLAMKHGLTANVRNLHGETPLMFAFRDRPWAPTNGAGSHVATVDWLVKHGVDINARDENGWSIALSAVTVPDFLALLMPGLDLNVADNKGESIWSARGWNSLPFAMRQTTIEVPLMLNGQPGRGPLHVAVKEAMLSDTKYFLQRGVNPNQVDQDGLTPLHEVVRWTGGSGDHRINRTLIVKALLNAGADVNARTTQGLTPLMLANAQPAEIIQILVDHKANVNATVMENGKQVSVMDYFLRKANSNGLEVLLKAGTKKQIHKTSGRTN